MARQQTFTANQPVTGSVNGYTLSLYGLQITLQRLYIGKGSIDISFGDPSLPASVAVPEDIVPSVKFNAAVNNYGAAGPAINQISVLMAWDNVVIGGDGIHSSTLNSLFDRVPRMYEFGQDAFNKLDIAELRELAMNQSLPEIALWRLIPNDNEVVRTLAPNPLTEKQMVIDEELPQTFTALALAALNGCYYLAFKLQQHQDRLNAFIDFYGWTTAPEGKAELLKRYDVTSQLPDSLPYCYFVYWSNLYAVGNNSPLYHVNLSLPAIYNCSIFGGYTYSPNIVFNAVIRQDYQNNTLTPMCCRFGMLPAAKTPAADPG